MEQYHENIEHGKKAWNAMGTSANNLFWRNNSGWIFSY